VKTKRSVTDPGRNIAPVDTKEQGEPRMKAAIVTTFDAPPTYGDFRDPDVRDGELLVHVRAAALTNLVKGQASGRHYSRDTSFPFVPGSDGVGHTSDGERVYFAFPRAPFGSMAERSVVRRAYAIGLPQGLDDVTAAAIGNPGMSSWAALVERARFQKGESVLVCGATGISGRLAVPIAKWLGARRVIAMGRNERVLESLRAIGADATIALHGEPATWAKAVREEVARDHVDVVLDYLWGPPAEQILAAFTGHGTPQGERRVRFVQIGSMAGATVTLSASALRSSGVELIGSGLGSVSWERLVAAVGEVMKIVAPAKLAVHAEPVALAHVAEAWAAKGDRRLVLTMGSTAGVLAGA
jgi:NADPH:quinone reductase-like Zn-dependent oxidoreductase